MSTILIRDGIIIPVVENSILEKGYVLIEGNRIKAVGNMEDLKTDDKPDIEIDARGKVVLPGFVNAHTHLATECFRGIIEMYPRLHFIFLVKNFLKERHLYDLSALGCLELIRFGTTCTGDNYQRSRFIAQSIADTGLRGVVSEQISEADLITGIYPSIYKYQPIDVKRQIKANEDLIEKWNGAENGRITCAFGPHAPDTLTPEIIREILAKADERGVRISTHLAQSLDEISIVKSRRKMSPVEYYAETGMLNPKTVVAHCTYLTARDVEILRASGAHIAHCPNNFIRKGWSTPLMPWLKGGIENIGIASDNILHDPFELMRITNYLALQYVKHIDPDTEHLVPTPYETLKMATMGSARALGLENEVGSLLPGKKADVAIVDFEKPHLTPNLDVVSNLVYYAKGNDVITTIIDGKIVMEGGEIKTVDESKILRNGQKASEEIWLEFNEKYRQFPEIAAKFKYFS